MYEDELSKPSFPINKRLHRSPSHLKLVLDLDKAEIARDEALKERDAARKDAARLKAELNRANSEIMKLRNIATDASRELVRLGNVLDSI